MVISILCQFFVLFTCAFYIKKAMANLCNRWNKKGIRLIHHHHHHMTYKSSLGNLFLILRSNDYQQQQQQQQTVTKDIWYQDSTILSVVLNFSSVFFSLYILSSPLLTITTISWLSSFELLENVLRNRYTCYDWFVTLFFFLLSMIFLAFQLL